VVLLQRGDREGHIREYDSAGNAGERSSASASRTGPRKVNPVASFDLEGMTVGERLLIARRRSNESQETVARQLGLTRNVYGRLERDDEDLHSGISLPELGELSQEEICVLLRRRAGLTQEECADKIGVTRFWFNQMETGKVSCADLVKFWENRA
jgi:DNA-binding XRE family transcriptional regulator